MKRTVVFVLIMVLSGAPALAQTTCGSGDYCGYTEREYEEPTNRAQQEKRLDPDELGGPSGSSSDYVRGTRDRRYERDEGGPGGEYGRDDYYRGEGY